MVIRPFESPQFAFAEAGIRGRSYDCLRQQWQRIQNSTNLIQVIRVRFAWFARVTQLPRPVRVGIEATGSMQWFVNLMEDLGIECQVGHPANIRDPIAGPD